MAYSLKRNLICLIAAFLCACAFVLIFLLRAAPAGRLFPAYQRIAFPPLEVGRNDAFWPQEPHPIALRWRNVLPRRNDGKPNDVTQIWLAQFGGPISNTDRARLLILGVEVLFPTTQCAFHVRCSERQISRCSKVFVPRILGWAALEPSDKILPTVLGHPPPQYACDVTSTFYRLELYPGASAESLRGMLRELNGSVRARGPNYVEVSLPSQLSPLKLAALDAVYAVDFPRPSKRGCNDHAKNASNVFTLSNAPRSLSGADVNIMVRDEGRIFAHPDLAARLTLNSDVISVPEVAHSTHVAGSIGGDGQSDVFALARGAAPGARLFSFDLNGDDRQEPLDAKNVYGAILSSHAYGFVTGWDNGFFNNNQSSFGSYSSFSRDWDSIIRSDGLIIVKAVGNDRNDSGPGNPHDGTPASDGEFYNCVDASSTSKNAISIGAAMDSAQASIPNAATSVLPSSSAGPTDDGRLKPELIYNGDDVNSCNSNAIPGTQYTRLSGTSMACGGATGMIALLIERYHQQAGVSANPSPHYIRALLGQTASDMGRPGPDYLHGMGMIDAQAAIQLIELDNLTGTRLPSRTLNSSTPERFFVFSSDGSQIKATLSWSDEPGDMLAARTLINDLDLRLIRLSDQIEVLPFKLNGNAPEELATIGVNNVDTIEQLVLNAPVPGNYILAVRGTTLATPTDFTLATTQALTETLGPRAVISASARTGQPPLAVTFDGSSSNDPDGTIARYIWTFGDNATAEGAQVVHTYGVGVFQATLKVIDNMGASATDSVTIAVNNFSPVSVISGSPLSGAPPLTCSFSGAASFDTDGVITQYRWDFGDGTFGTDADIVHTYTAPGLYYPTLTVTDNGEATGLTSIPVLVGETLNVRSSSFSLNFVKPGVDRFTLTSKNFPVPVDMATLDLHGALTVGARSFLFILDAKGRFKSPPLSLSLTPKRTRLKVTLSRASLVQALKNSGATSRTIKNDPIAVPFALSLSNGIVAGSNALPYKYTGKKDKSGKGKIVLP